MTCPVGQQFDFCENFKFFHKPIKYPGMGLGISIKSFAIINQYREQGVFLCSRITMQDCVAGLHWHWKHNLECSPLKLRPGQDCVAELHWHWKHNLECSPPETPSRAPSFPEWPRYVTSIFWQYSTSCTRSYRSDLPTSGRFLRHFEVGNFDQKMTFYLL